MECCSTEPEEFKCSECGMTGPEIYMARFEADNGIEHIGHHLNDLTQW